MKRILSFISLLVFLTLKTSSNKSFHNSVGAGTLDSGGVEISPSQVGLISNLRIFAYLDTNIPVDGSIVMVFPKQITQMPQSTNCRMVRSIQKLMSFLDCAKRHFCNMLILECKWAHLSKGTSETANQWIFQHRDTRFH